MPHPALAPAAQRPATRARGARDAVLPELHDPEHNEAIVASHERCVALGVSRIDAPDLGPVARAEFTLALERNRRLHEHAAPVMELLFDQIERTESMVVLTDALGTVIHAIGDDDFLGRASKVALRPGANWSERSKGTNAVGTALVDERPTLVHGDEHFLHANSFLTCSAAPILDPRGNLLGVLDVSGDFRSYHRHTLALVRMSARMIENRWLNEDFGDALRLHFHARPEFIGTLMEGIVAIARDGRLIGANRSALEQLGLSGAALRMQTLGELFGTTLEALVDHCRSGVLRPLQLALADGRSLPAFVRCHWPVWLSAGPVVAPQAATEPGAGHALSGPAAPPVAPVPGALQALRSGDAMFDAVVDKVGRVLDRDIPLLILGETGTGKELLARAIHADSARRDRPFLRLSGAALSEALAAPAAFRCGGTVFLDEIGDIDLTQQGQLLRVLQTIPSEVPGAAAPPGSTALICATHRHLPTMIEAGAFREDLYYRLNGLAVRLPALRERSDLPTLVRRILDAEGGPQRRRLAPELLPLFTTHAWPGNVRQLFQVLRTACAMAGQEPTLARRHLPDDFLASTLAGLGPRGAMPRTLDEEETELIRRTLAAVNGNISEAAKRLGISRNTIYRKLRWRRPEEPVS